MKPLRKDLSSNRTIHFQMSSPEGTRLCEGRAGQRVPVSARDLPKQMLMALASRCPDFGAQLSICGSPYGSHRTIGAVKAWAPGTAVLQRALPALSSSSDFEARNKTHLEVFQLWVINYINISLPFELHKLKIVQAKAWSPVSLVTPRAKEIKYPSAIRRFSWSVTLKRRRSEGCCFTFAELDVQWCRCQKDAASSRHKLFKASR